MQYWQKWGFLCHVAFVQDFGPKTHIGTLETDVFATWDRSQGTRAFLTCESLCRRCVRRSMYWGAGCLAARSLWRTRTCVFVNQYTTIQTADSPIRYLPGVRHDPFRLNMAGVVVKDSSVRWRVILCGWPWPAHGMPPAVGCQIPLSTLTTTSQLGLLEKHNVAYNLSIIELYQREKRKIFFLKKKVWEKLSTQCVIRVDSFITVVLYILVYVTFNLVKTHVAFLKALI